jgi:hypothetical protein
MTPLTTLAAILVGIVAFHALLVVLDPVWSAL